MLCLICGMKKAFQIGALFLQGSKHKIFGFQIFDRGSY